MIQFDSFMQAEGVPIYQQIIRYVKQGIAAGTIRDGEELPSRRVLSALLAVNPNTVQKAYRQLEDEGLICSHAGAISCVSAGQERAEALRTEMVTACAEAVVGQMKRMGLSREETVELVGRIWDEAEEGGAS